jgi:hypothetical protein
MPPISHALLLATHTPIRALLLTATESWLFGRKTSSLASWTAAKATLRTWTHTAEASQAVWHATTLLRAAFPRGGEDGRGVGVGVAPALHMPWILYLAALACWAYGAPPSQLVEAGEMLAAPPVPPQSHPTPHPPPASLIARNAGATVLQRQPPAWEYLDRVGAGGEGTLSLRGKGGTDGVLVAVREALRLGTGKLIDEAGRTLERVREKGVRF